MNYFIAGEGALVLEGGEERPVRAGDFVLIHPGERHRYRNTAASDLVMIGSRRKREAVFRNLRAAGFTAEDLGRVRCPIGLNIGATPRCTGFPDPAPDCRRW